MTHCAAPVAGARGRAAIRATARALAVAVGLAAVAPLSLAACSDDGSATAAEGEAGAGAIPPLGDGGVPRDGAAARDAAAIDWTVNGHALTTSERTALTVIADDVMPRLEGAREERLTVASRAAWWALKEGTWERALDRVMAYSNCNTSAGDREIGPLESCGTGKAWQVGLAAVQVPGRGVADLETLRVKLYPGVATNTLLADVATRAGQPPSVRDAIVASTGALRASWLLRVPAIGVAVVVPGEISPECIEGTKSWCFGTAWDETKKFAPTKAAALVAIADLKRILTALGD